MPINNDLNVNLMNLISKTLITSIDDFPIDVQPNRIKEKRESLKNTLKNCLNIPVSKTYFEEKRVEENKLFNIINGKLDVIENGKSKPINVRSVVLDRLKNIEPIANVSKVDENNSDISGSKKDSVTNHESIDSLIESLGKFREEVNIKNQKVDLEKSELENSNNVIKELGIQYDERKKILKEAEEKNMQLERELILEINSQIDELNNKLVDADKLLQEIDKKKNENRDKIVEFKRKIDSAEEKINRVTEDNDKKKQMLNFFNDNKLENSIGNDNQELFTQLKKIA